MAPNVTIYCLEELTDYFEFERLCHDVLSREEYDRLEPLGGSKDKGRDALHISPSNTVTIFAYSVREDWRAKLAEDAAKIHRHGHTCDELVFLTTARYTAGERDEAVASIKNTYGWRLELYGVERLRILLEVTHPDIRALHPQIFPPQFFPIHQTTHQQAWEHLFISYSPEDTVFADWLAKRLTAEGYRVWWEGMQFLGSEAYPDDVDNAIQEQSFRMLGLYSQASLSNPEVMRQRSLALTVARQRKTDFLIPLNVDGVQPHQLDRVSSILTFIPFESNWAIGLKYLLQKLEGIGCPKPLLTGKTIAAAMFLEDDVLSDQTEVVFSNCLPVEHIPPLILRFAAKHAFSEHDLLDMRLQWAFRKLDPKVFLSLHEPNATFMNRYHLQLIDSTPWIDNYTVYGVRARDLLVELIRKALVVKCQQKGLVYCPDSNLQYFPSGLVADDRLKFTRPDGHKTHVLTTGQRKYWRPQGSQDYRYYLSPTFSVIQWPFDDYTVMVRMRVRISDTANNVLPKRTSNSRRKHLCHDWWNHEWFNRMIAMCQFLANAHGKISIGDCLEEELLIHATPLSMTAPISINEAALDQRSFERPVELIRSDDNDGEEGVQEITNG